jgi:hypothetical protein
MKLHLVTSLTISLALALGAVGMAAAVDDPGTADQSQPQSVSEILTLQHGLRERLDKPYGEYSQFDEAAIARMKRAQDHVFQMLQGVQSLNQLTPEQKTDLSNSLDEIKATLLANAGNRQICHRERRTGSNLIELRCETVASREARARDSSEEMRRLAPTAQTRGGN